MKICQNGSTFFGWNRLTLLHSIWLFFQKDSGILPVILKSYPQDAHKIQTVFSHLPSIHPTFLIFPLWPPWYLHRWTASGTKGATNGVDIREAKICQNANKKTHKTKGKAWWSTQLHTTNHRLWKKQLPFLAGLARPFSGIKCHPQGRANPKQV